jgi:hypothetical protein
MSDAKVSSFAEAKSKLAEKGPNEYAIACARELLAKCESGEIVGMLIMVRNREGGTSQAAAGAISYGDTLMMMEDWKYDQNTKRSGR